MRMLILKSILRKSFFSSFCRASRPPYSASLSSSVKPGECMESAFASSTEWAIVRAIGESKDHQPALHMALK